MAKMVGFFFELPEDEQRDCLRGLCRNEPDPDELAIVQYLLAGVAAGVSMTIEHDVLQEPPRVLGEARLQSDGEWIWPSSLAYYVGEYHVKLPDEFINTMRRNGWRVPASANSVDGLPDGHIEM